MSAAATDLWRMSATDLAGAIRSRQVSSREVIEAHLQRIEAVDPSVNAITTLLADQAPKAPRQPTGQSRLCLDAAAALEDRLGIVTPIDPP